MALTSGVTVTHFDVCNFISLFVRIMGLEVGYRVDIGSFVYIYHIWAPFSACMSFLSQNP